MAMIVPGSPLTNLSRIMAYEMTQNDIRDVRENVIFVWFTKVNLSVLMLS